MRKALNAGLIATVAISAAACQESPTAGPDTGNASVSFTTIQPSAVGFQSADSINVGGHVISLTSADLRLSKLEIEGDSIEIEVRSGTTVVGLPLDGRVVTPVTFAVLPGTYREMEITVESVRLQGRFDGQPFDVTLRVLAKVEQHIDPPLVVTQSGTANMTVALDVGRWFTNGTGAAINLLNLSTEAQAQLVANIRSSFHAFDDDDHDGQGDDDDDGDDDGDDHGGRSGND
jgi:hypothetical protein